MALFSYLIFITGVDLYDFTSGCLLNFSFDRTWPHMMSFKAFANVLRSVHPHLTRPRASWNLKRRSNRLFWIRSSRGESPFRRKKLVCNPSPAVQRSPRKAHLTPQWAPMLVPYAAMGGWASPIAWWESIKRITCKRGCMWLHFSRAMASKRLM